MPSEHPSMALGSWGIGRPDSVLLGLQVFPRKMAALMIYVTVSSKKYAMFPLQFSFSDVPAALFHTFAAHL